jgi:succinate dehydrogenase / fumarate reductase cytochrome b subunit
VLVVMQWRFWQTIAPSDRSPRRRIKKIRVVQQQRRPLSPHLQIYRPLYTLVLSISHRITGVLLSMGSLLLVYWLWALAGSAARYASIKQCMASGWVKLLLLALMLSFFYHLCNGIRHLVWDLGFGFEKQQARAGGWAVVVIALLLTVVSAVMVARLIGDGA